MAASKNGLHSASGGPERQSPADRLQVTSMAVQERRRLFRSGLEALFGAESEFELIAAAESDVDLVRIVERAPDVDAVAFELRCDVWDVGALVRSLRTIAPGALLIGLHRGRRADHEQFATSIAIDELLPYGAGVEMLKAALRGHPRTRMSSPSVDRRVLPARDVLTPREREVLRHISAGLTTQQSAALLEVSPKTVDNHKQRMFAKLGVQNQAHAVAVAHRAGILRPRRELADG